jgi:hypothetical protein
MIEFPDSTSGFAGSGDQALRMPVGMVSKMQRLSFSCQGAGLQNEKRSSSIAVQRFAE